MIKTYDVLLGDVVNIKSSKRVKMSDYRSIGVPFYRSKEIIQKASGKKIDTQIFISESQYQSFQQKHGAPKEGDLLLTSVGTLGIPYLVRKTDERFYFKDGNLTWFSNFSYELNSEYLYYFFQSKYGKQTLNAISIGSTQAALTIDALKNISIKLPPLSRQKAIAHILGTLDEKIELNRKTNETLEGIAKTLFRSWFIDFDPVRAKVDGRSTGLPHEISELFPDSFEDSELGQIPCRWQFRALRDIANFQNGYTFNSKEYIDKNETSMEVFRMGYIDRGGGFKEDNSPVFIATSSKGYQEKYLIEKNDLTIAMTDMKDKMAILGCCALIEDNKRFVLNQRVGRIRVVDSELVDPRYLYIYMNYPTHIDLIRSKSNSGVQVNLSMDVIKNTSILIPDKSVMKVFKILSRKLFSQICNNNKEIKILVQVRNTLLPKLISGELRIPDAEKMHEEVGI